MESGSRCRRIADAGNRWRPSAGLPSGMDVHRSAPSGTAPRVTELPNDVAGRTLARMAPASRRPATTRYPGSPSSSRRHAAEPVACCCRFVRAGRRRLGRRSPADGDDSARVASATERAGAPEPAGAPPTVPAAAAPGGGTARVLLTVGIDTISGDDPAALCGGSLRITDDFRRAEADLEVRGVGGGPGGRLLATFTCDATT